MRNVAFLGARLLLQSYVTADAPHPAPLSAVQQLLQDSLHHDPSHAGAFGTQAASPR